MSNEFIKSTTLLLVVLNPAALSVYLIDVVRHTSLAEFTRILLRATAISGVVFSVFAYFGSDIFTDVLQIRFAAFQVFGGTLFLIVALRFMLTGSQTLVSLRGEPGRVAGAIAMPFMIGPGSVGAAAVAGLRLPAALAVLSVLCALLATLIVLIALKTLFDHLKKEREALVERYVELASRVSAMVVGSIAVEMIFSGIERWLGGVPR
jgi:small neutral amino acid transporter SnatA (MarC family)